MDGSVEEEQVLSDQESTKILEEARARFKESADYDNENRNDSIDDIKFVWNYQNYQWPDEAKRVREGRPMLVENRCSQFVRQVVNENRRNRPAISVIPFDDKADPKTATILEGLIRHIEQYSRADMAYDKAGESAVMCSIGHFRVTTDYSSDEGFDQEICIKPIDNALSVYDDPGCIMPDRSDRRYCFVSEKVKRTEFKEEYGFEATPFDDVRGAGDDMQMWFEEDEVRVAEYWRVVKDKSKIHRMEDGAIFTDEQLKEFKKIQPDAKPVISREVEKKTVEQYILTGDKVIKKTTIPSKYIGIVTVIGDEINIEGKKLRKSLIRDAKDAQRAINYMASAIAEVIALSPKVPWVGPSGAFETDAVKWKNMNTKNYAFVEYDGHIKPERTPFIAVYDGLLNAKMQAIEAMKAIMGLYDASLGARSNETSGVALAERKEQGNTQTFHFMDNLVRAIRYAGLCIIDLAPKVYDATRVIRILGKDGTPDMAQINAIFMGPDGSLQSTDLSVGRYDVVVKAGPGIETQRQENRQNWVDLAKVVPQLAQVAPDLLAKNMDSPDSEEIAQRLKATVPPQVLGATPGAIPPEVQQAMQQVQQAQQQIMAAGQALEQEQAKNEGEKAKMESVKSDIQNAMQLLGETERRIKAEIELFWFKQEQSAKSQVEAAMQPPNSTLNDGQPTDNPTTAVVENA